MEGTLIPNIFVVVVVVVVVVDAMYVCMLGQVQSNKVSYSLGESGGGCTKWT